MTQMEYWCEIFSRVFFWIVLSAALYGCWWDETEKRQGRAIDAYLNGRAAVIHLPPMEP